MFLGSFSVLHFRIFDVYFWVGVSRLSCTHSSEYVFQYVVPIFFHQIQPFQLFSNIIRFFLEIMDVLSAPTMDDVREILLVLNETFPTTIIVVHFLRNAFL